MSCASTGDLRRHQQAASDVDSDGGGRVLRIGDPAERTRGGVRQRKRKAADRSETDNPPSKQALSNDNAGVAGTNNNDDDDDGDGDENANNYDSDVNGGKSQSDQRCPNLQALLSEQPRASSDALAALFASPLTADQSPAARRLRSPSDGDSAQRSLAPPAGRHPQRHWQADAQSKSSSKLSEGDAAIQKDVIGFDMSDNVRDALGRPSEDSNKLGMQVDSDENNNSSSSKLATASVHVVSNSDPIAAGLGATFGLTRNDPPLGKLAADVSATVSVNGLNDSTAVTPAPNRSEPLSFGGRWTACDQRNGSPAGHESGAQRSLADSSVIIGNSVAALECGGGGRSDRDDGTSPATSVSDAGTAVPTAIAAAAAATAALIAAGRTHDSINERDVAAAAVVAAAANAGADLTRRVVSGESDDQDNDEGDVEDLDDGDAQDYDTYDEEDDIYDDEDADDVDVDDCDEETAVEPHRMSEALVASALAAATAAAAAAARTMGADGTQCALPANVMRRSGHVAVTPTGADTRASQVSAKPAAGSHTEPVDVNTAGNTTATAAVAGAACGVTAGAAADRANGDAAIDALGGDDVAVDSAFPDGPKLPPLRTMQALMVAGGKMDPALKDVQCPICFKIFSRKFSLEMHYLIHQGIKPYTCDHCGRNFRQKGTLMRHKAIHNQTPTYQCDLCDRSYRQKNVFLHHLRNRHKISTDTMDRRRSKSTGSHDDPMNGAGIAAGVMGGTAVVSLPSAVIASSSPLISQGASSPLAGPGEICSSPPKTVPADAAGSTLARVFVSPGSTANDSSAAVSNLNGEATADPARATVLPAALAAPAGLLPGLVYPSLLSGLVSASSASATPLTVGRLVTSTQAQAVPPAEAVLPTMAFHGIQSKQQHQQLSGLRPSLATGGTMLSSLSLPVTPACSVSGVVPSLAGVTITPMPPTSVAAVPSTSPIIPVSSQQSIPDLFLRRLLNSPNVLMTSSATTSIQEHHQQQQLQHHQQDNQHQVLGQQQHNRLQLEQRVQHVPQISSLGQVLRNGSSDSRAVLADVSQSANTPSSAARAPQGKLWLCPLCGNFDVVFDNEDKFHKHFLEHLKDTTFPCITCGQHFTTLPSLLAHAQQAHGSNSTASTAIATLQAAAINPKTNKEGAALENLQPNSCVAPPWQSTSDEGKPRNLTTSPKSVPERYLLNFGSTNGSENDDGHYQKVFKQYPSAIRHSPQPQYATMPSTLLDWRILREGSPGTEDSPLASDNVRRSRHRQFDNRDRLLITCSLPASDAAVAAAAAAATAASSNSTSSSAMAALGVALLMSAGVYTSNGCDGAALTATPSGNAQTTAKAESLSSFATPSNMTSGDTATVSHEALMAVASSVSQFDALDSYGAGDAASASAARQSNGSVSGGEWDANNNRSELRHSPAQPPVSTAGKMTFTCIPCRADFHTEADLEHHVGRFHDGSAGTSPPVPAGAPLMPTDSATLPRQARSSPTTLPLQKDPHEDLEQRARQLQQLLLQQHHLQLLQQQQQQQQLPQATISEYEQLVNSSVQSRREPSALAEKMGPTATSAERAACGNLLTSALSAATGVTGNQLINPFLNDACALSIPGLLLARLGEAARVAARAGEQSPAGQPHTTLPLDCAAPEDLSVHGGQRRTLGAASTRDPSSPPSSLSSRSGNTAEPAAPSMATTADAHTRSLLAYANLYDGDSKARRRKTDSRSNHVAS